jgi:hypothetical protein
VIADGDQRHTLVAEQHGCVRAHVAEALHDQLLSFEHEARALRPPADAVHEPLAGGLVAAVVPPLVTGLPVTTPITACLLTMPTVFMYVSIAHAMICALVPCRAPECRSRTDVGAERVEEPARDPLQLVALTSRGLNLMPPLPPPNGSS